ANLLESCRPMCGWRESCDSRLPPDALGGKETPRRNLRPRVDNQHRRRVSRGAGGADDGLSDDGSPAVLRDSSNAASQACSGTGMLLPGFSTIEERSGCPHRRRVGMIDLSKWPPAEAEEYRTIIRDMRRVLEGLKTKRGAGAYVPASIVNMVEEFLEEREERAPH